MIVWSLEAPLTKCLQRRSSTRRIHRNRTPTIPPKFGEFLHPLRAFTILDRSTKRPIASLSVVPPLSHASQHPQVKRAPLRRRPFRLRLYSRTVDRNLRHTANTNASIFISYPHSRLSSLPTLPWRAITAILCLFTILQHRGCKPRTLYSCRSHIYLGRCKTSMSCHM